MSINLSKQFIDELDGWKESIEFYTETLESIGDRLAEVISRNSIVDIAAKVEVYQIMLDKMIINMKLLTNEIETQVQSIKEDVNLVDDKLITTTISENQKSLRDKIQKSEREYIDVKFECNEFLSTTLKK